MVSCPCDGPGLSLVNVLEVMTRPGIFKEVVLAHPKVVQLDDWLRRERFVFVGWSLRIILLWEVGLPESRM